MTSIAITGPESSGKSSLARAITESLNAAYAPEYARMYLEIHGPHYSETDLLLFAQEQMKIWSQLKNSSLFPNDHLIADTELTTIKIWSEEKFKRVNQQIIEMYHEQQFDLYLLCYPDIPWEPDPLRENEHDRERLFTLYENELMGMNRNFIVVRGTQEVRLKTSLAKIHSLHTR